MIRHDEERKQNEGDGGFSVTAKARRREDRAGDPLDGLVNLFDLGIVLSVAFLIAALSSLNLSPSALEGSGEGESESSQEVPADAVLADPEDVRSIEIEPGQEVVGRGEPLGTVYQLEDGRTVIVEDGEGAGGTPTDDAGTEGLTAPEAGTPGEGDVPPLP